MYTLMTILVYMYMFICGGVSVNRGLLLEMSLLYRRELVLASKWIMGEGSQQITERGTQG